MNETFEIKQGDTRKPLKVELSDFNGVVDLTGCTVRFFMSTHYYKLIIDKEVEIVDAVNGQVWHVFGFGDTNESGAFHGEFEVTFPDFKKETFPESNYISIKINKSLE